jgi:hypothetical protein
MLANRYFFPLIFFLILIEGLVRKTIPSIGTQAFLLKDLVIFIVFFLQLPFYKISKSFKVFGAVFFIYFLVFFISLFSLILSDTSVYLYLLGFREYFFYVIVIPIAYNYFRILDLDGINQLVQKFLYIGVFISLLGIFQSLGILELDFLKIIKEYHQEHSSIAGVFYFTVSIFDVPEKFAIFNILLFMIVYSSIRSKQQITSHDYLFLAIFAICIIISGRRGAVFLTLLIILYDFAIYEKTTKGVLLAIIALIISPLFLYFSVASIDPVLAEIIFSSNTLENAWYYLNWSIGLFLNAFQNVDLLSGYFGITSPGSDVIEGKYDIFTYEIEGFWDKTLFAMGVLGTILLLISFVILLTIMSRIRSKFRQDYLVRGIVYYLIVIFAWGIKSGNFLVWAPITFLILALFYRRYEIISFGTKQTTRRLIND